MGGAYFRGKMSVDNKSDEKKKKWHGATTIEVSQLRAQAFLTTGAP